MQKFADMKPSFLLILVLLSAKIYAAEALLAEDVLSITSFTNPKTSQKIYVLGTQATLPNKPNSPILQYYKDFIQNLSKGAPIRCILPIPAEELPLIQTGKTECSPTTLTNLLIQSAANNSCQLGTITYSVDKYPEALTLHNLLTLIFTYFEPEVLRLIGSTLLCPKDWIERVIEFRQDGSKADPFFEKKEYFTRLKEGLLLVATTVSLDPPLSDYVTIIKNYDKKCATVSKHPLLSYLQKQWPTASRQARDYIATRIPKKTIQQAKLIHMLFSAIEDKQSFLAGLEEFHRIVLIPLIILQKLERNLCLINALTSCNKVLVCFPFRSTELSNPLKSLGFQEDSIGLFADNGEILSLKRNPFSSLQLHAYLKAIVDDTFSTQSITPDTASLCSYYDPHTRKFTDTSSKDRTKRNCLQCNNPTQVCEAFAITTTACYCSLKCTLKKLSSQKIGAGLSLEELLAPTHDLSKEETAALKQFGALCYVQTALLIPSLADEHGIVYQLILTPIINALDKLSKYSDKNGITTALCKAWHINLAHLRTALNDYKQHKELYLKNLFKAQKLGKVSYNNLSVAPAASFNGKSICDTLQKPAFSLLKDAFTFTANTHDTSLQFIYHKLVKRINKRIGLPVNKIAALLEVEYTQEPLEKILTAIGHEEHPPTNKSIHPSGSFYEMLALQDEIDPEEDEKSPALPVEQAGPQSSLAHPTKVVLAPSSLHSTKTIHAIFAGRKPYTITLFKTHKFIPQELSEAYKLWQAYPNAEEAWRIKILFALAHQAQETCCSLSNDDYGCPLIQYSGDNSHKSVKEKLNLDHLFTRKVDTFLKRYGIAECIENLIQISIPGKIECGDYKRIGFFQYTFIPKEESTYEGKPLRIHRCFKSYDVSTQDLYVSKTLRTILYKYFSADNLPENREIIIKLTRALERYK